MPPILFRTWYTSTRKKPLYSAVSIILLTYLMSRALLNSVKIARIFPDVSQLQEAVESSSSSWWPSSSSTITSNMTNNRTLPSNSNNRTLVILIGNVRGGERAWDSLYRNVLDINMADLALFIGDTRVTYQNASLFNRARYVWRFQEYDDWADAIDLLQNGTSSWRKRLIPMLHEESKLLGGIKGHGYQGSGAIIFVIRWLLSKQLQELGMLQQYDRFVITRADHYYRCAHDISLLNDNNLWVPSGEDYNGITDRHLVVSSRHILSALNVLPPIVQNPEQYPGLLARRKSNPERLLLRRWVEEGLVTSIRRFNRMFFTCGETGETSRWTQVGSELVSPEQVYLKYPNEYDAAYRTCGLKKDRQYGDKVIPLVPEKPEVYYNSNEQRSRLQSLIATPPPTTTNAFSSGDKKVGTLRNEDCYIRFKNPSMRLCNFVPYGNNFGDELGPAVSLRILQEYFECTNVTAIPVVNLALVAHPKKRVPDEPCLFTVGSIFHFIRPGDHVWGTGINPFRVRKEMYATDIVVHSVRGPLSLEWLLDKRSSFTTASLVGYGDPGFLTPFLYTEYLSTHTGNSKAVATSSSSSKNKTLCFVPHFHDLESEPVKSLQNNNNTTMVSATATTTAVKIISPHSSWRNVVHRLHDECDHVASSSLHGIIMADCLGIPSQWVQMDGTQTKTTEGHFKYQDYFQSFVDNSTSSSDNIHRTTTSPIREPSQIHNKTIYGTALSTMTRIQFAQKTIASFPIRLFEIVHQKK